MADRGHEVLIGSRQYGLHTNSNKLSIKFSHTLYTLFRFLYKFYMVG